jgi:type I restriction enzyme S subunit
MMLFDNTPDGWFETTLGEICSKAGGSIQTGPFGSQLHASDYVSRGIPSIMPANITGGRVREDGIARITESDAERLSKYLVQEGDIVYSRRGDVEKCALITESENGWLCGTGCLRVRLGEDVVNPLFASYFLSHPESKAWISRHAVGATMPNLNTGILSDVPFLLPPSAEQEAIAQILGTLDDKIELNEKMNQTLEDIAKAIFKSWFVDFDPVRAKAEGRPTGLPPEISDLFPDDLVDSEIGEIPKGWDVTNVGEITSKETLKVKKFSAEVKVLSAVNSGQLRLSEEYFTKQVFSKNIDNYYVVPRLSFAYNPSRINIGSIGLNLFDFSGAVSPVYSVFTVREGMHWFFREWLNLGSTKGLIASLCSGSVRQSLKHPDMESILLVPPPTSVNTKFNEIYELFMKSIRVRNQENQVLYELRDTLLPKLISGELRIPEAEKFLEEAGL